jgi:drug/metabolite transporter (DMT)-like permease
MAGAVRYPLLAGVGLALASAVTFGLTTPIVARFGTGVGAFWTAALLYAGAAGIALLSRVVVVGSGRALSRADAPRLLAVAACGAAFAPTLLAWGLSRAGATASSLLLNFEAAFTVLLARVLYRETFGRRVRVALALMLAGGCLVVLDSARASAAEPVQALGLLAVLAATGFWAADNTLTRGLAEQKPLDVVAAKGTLGSVATVSLALLLGEPRPTSSQAVALLGCGATGYGLSLSLYILAQRRIGAGRTGSVFALGPFVGAAFAWLLGDRAAGPATWLAAAAFGLGVYLHLTEGHAHRHVHEALEHEHAHRHDDGHHDHLHDPPFVGEHTHPHRHERREHEHDHEPDVHHAHPHS